MSELAKKFMEHSGTDEFGNLVLLFEDKKIKMAIGEDGEPLLSRNDLNRSFELKWKKASVHARDGEHTLCKFDCGLYKKTEAFVKPEFAHRDLCRSRKSEVRRFVEFIDPNPRIMQSEEKPPLDAWPNHEGLEYRLVRGNEAYCVADNGSVWSSKRGEWRQISQAISRNGYFRVPINENGVTTKALVHRLVLTAFVGPPGPKQITLHGNGIKTDNRICNLRWGTDFENAQDKVRHRSEEIERSRLRILE